MYMLYSFGDKTHSQETIEDIDVSPWPSSSHSQVPSEASATPTRKTNTGAVYLSDEDFFMTVASLAAKRSKDPSRQVSSTILILSLICSSVNQLVCMQADLGEAADFPSPSAERCGPDTSHQLHCVTRFTLCSPSCLLQTLLTLSGSTNSCMMQSTSGARTRQF